MAPSAKRQRDAPSQSPPPSSQRRRTADAAWSAANYSSAISHIVSALGPGANATIRLPPPGSTAFMELAVSTASATSSHVTAAHLASPHLPSPAISARRASPSPVIVLDPEPQRRVAQSSSSLVAAIDEDEVESSLATSSTPSSARQSRRLIARRDGQSQASTQLSSSSSMPSTRSTPPTEHSALEHLGDDVDGEPPEAYYRRHVKQLFRIDSDGHCGFAALAKALGLNISGYQMRLRMMRWIHRHKEECDRAFAGLTDAQFNTMLHQLLPSGRLPENEHEHIDFAKSCRTPHFMRGVMIQIAAEMEQRPIASISRLKGKKESVTYLPTALQDLCVARLQSAVCVVYNGIDHYDWGILDPQEPLPPVRTDVWLSSDPQHRKTLRSQAHMIQHEKYVFETRVPDAGSRASRLCSCLFRTR